MWYHLGFGARDLGETAPLLAFLSGDPQRTEAIAHHYLQNARCLAENRGLVTYWGELENKTPVLASTSGMGAPSLSIVVNELIQAGIQHVIRIGTCGAIQPHIEVGSVVITQGALCRQGAAWDIAPVEYPAVADPFWTVALVEAARSLHVPYHLGLTASVDTFYEGQGRQNSSASPYLQPHLRGITEEYQQLNLLNYEMEAGTLFKMAGVYGFKAACICGVVAQRNHSENIDTAAKQSAIHNAIRVAVKAATHFRPYRGGD
ncbi:MAG: nucleoside phosphorylase [Jaaginema sp. PMC 1079.18]|nr:nucleoside phosphorylase [Jaaginema sp. PMC 1080.18]MEC4849882.1 nucleoside phosphorylase [Jaaginema sp. PMC 1079.18]MEC4866871.1 nucleoside phosphorylase [Jaaginema sp. PMC 1078.18]